MVDGPGTDEIRRGVEEARICVNELVGCDEIMEQVATWSRVLASCLESGGTVFFCGNGGSFADALHLAAEFTGTMGRPRRPLAAIALGANGSGLTAISNDFDYETALAREFEGLCNGTSVLVCLSTSGNSSNVVEAARVARRLGQPVVGMTGVDGGALATVCEVIRVPSSRTERIQEMHIILGHVLCGAVETSLGV